MSNFHKNLILFTFSLVLSLTVAEYASKFYILNFDRTGYLKSKHSDMIYEFIPNLPDQLSNSIGIRDYERPQEKPPRTFRIAGVGDSFMYGAYMKLEDTYMKRLEKRLNQETKNIKFETINFAVEGYNTAQEAAMFEHKAIKYDPDLLLIGYYLNDKFLPNIISLPDDAWFSESYLFNMIIRFLENSRFWESSINNFLKHRVLKMYYNYFFPEPGLELVPMVNLHPVQDPRQAPERYRHMLGWEGVEKALKRIAILAGKQDIPVVVLGDLPKKMIRLAKNNGFYTINYGPYLESYLKKNNLQKYALWYTYWDDHLNKQGHKLVADCLYKNLVNFNLLSSGIGR